jgi:pimeloyl-ACP methyl ester carboxylesterase
MSLLDRVKERTASDLSDAELQAMIDAISAELDARFGPVGEQTVKLGDLDDPQSSAVRNLRLALPIDESQAVTIVERNPGNSGAAGDRTTLDPGDFEVLHGGRTLMRLTGGPNGARHWAPLVEVTYTPQSNAAAREEATIKLIQLDLSYRGGLKSEKAGDYSFTLSGDIAADREAILQTLADRRGLVMA